VDLEALGFIHAGIITDVEDEALATRVFADNGSEQPDDYYASGIITFTTGDNADISREVGQFTSKIFQVGRPFPFPVQVGDSYVAVRGDDKTKATCKDIFMNYVNFGGFPDIPGINHVFSRPTTDIGGAVTT
jgi:uncharacterized phage protein (TIGR02218 family)